MDAIDFKDCLKDGIRQITEKSIGIAVGKNFGNHKHRQHNKPGEDMKPEDWPDYAFKYNTGPISHTEGDYYCRLQQFADVYCKRKIHDKKHYKKCLSEMKPHTKRQFDAMYALERKFCERNRLTMNGDKGDYEHMIHKLVRTARHLHPTTIRKLIDVMRTTHDHHVDWHTCQLHIKQLLFEENLFYRDMVEPYDYRYVQYMLVYDGLLHTFTRYLALLGTDIVLLEWCGSWRNQIQFWVAENGLGKNLLRHAQGKNGLPTLRVFKNAEGKKIKLEPSTYEDVVSFFNKIEFEDIHLYLLWYWKMGHKHDCAILDETYEVTPDGLSNISDFVKFRVEEFEMRRHEFLRKFDKARFKQHVVYFANMADYKAPIQKTIGGFKGLKRHHQKRAQSHAKFGSKNLMLGTNTFLVGKPVHRDPYKIQGDEDANTRALDSDDASDHSEEEEEVFDDEYDGTFGGHGQWDPSNGSNGDNDDDGKDDDYYNWNDEMDEDDIFEELKGRGYDEQKAEEMAADMYDSGFTCGDFNEFLDEEEGINTEFVWFDTHELRDEDREAYPDGMMVFTDHYGREFKYSYDQMDSGDGPASYYDENYDPNGTEYFDEYGKPIDWGNEDSREVFEYTPRGTRTREVTMTNPHKSRSLKNADNRGGMRKRNGGGGGGIHGVTETHGRAKRSGNATAHKKRQQGGAAKDRHRQKARNIRGR